MNTKRLYLWLACVAACIAAMALGVYVGLVFARPPAEGLTVVVSPGDMPSVETPPPPKEAEAKKVEAKEAEAKEAQQLTERVSTKSEPPSARPAPAKAKAAPPPPRGKAAPSPAKTRMQTQAVNCTMPTYLWTHDMELKLMAYAQQLNRRWGDNPEVKKDIVRAFTAHRNKISNNDGSQGACEKISKDLDHWLRHTRPVSG